MKIGIIGAGRIGATLARRLTALGHDVVIANSRGPETLRELAAETGARAMTAAAIADRILCAAMRRVGDLWHAGEMSVAQEHVATRTATNALRSIGAVTARVDKGEGALALCCSVEEDFHLLPVQLAALTLEAGGVEVFEMGMSTPFSALAEAVERFRPRLVCVSSAVLVGLDRAAREYAEFYKTARRGGAAVVGG